MPAMKAHVWVMPKRTVLDPQGQAIQHALSSLGFNDVREVRQGKFFVLDWMAQRAKPPKNRSNAWPAKSWQTRSSRNSGTKSSIRDGCVRNATSELLIPGNTPLLGQIFDSIVLIF